MEREFFRPEDLIHSYSRAQAIGDGVLVDVTEHAREAGFVVPVAVTQAVWTQVVVPPQKAKDQGECETGRLWDILYIASRRAGEAQGYEVLFYVLATNNRGRRKLKRLKAVSGPGDDGEHVITIMLPDED